MKERKWFMFAGFNLSLQSDIVLDRFANKGWQLYSNQRKQVHSTLDQYVNSDGSLSAAKMEEEWFAQISAEVFLSHSHADEKLAINLAGYLYDNFGIRCFIDSCVWGYANDLLREIDDKYCKTIKNVDDSYSYNYKYRNQSTSHVHMLLNGALAKMINSTECLIFLNTPNSIKAQEATDISKTASPWIYSELLMATEFPRQDWRHYRTSQHVAIYEAVQLQVEYDVYVDKLISLSLSDLRKAGEDSGSQGPTAVLDQLYINKGLIKCKGKKG